MRGAAERKAVAVPLPAVKLLQGRVRECVDRRFKDGDLTAVRFLRRQAKAERLVAAVNVFLDLLVNPSHTGKFYFARFVFTDEHTDGNDLLVLLRLIFALVKQTQLTAPLDNLCADPAFSQIFEISGRALLRPREIQLCRTLLLWLAVVLRICGLR